jgi:hypothetical protein
MIIDKQTLFSEAQAITADAASTNVYDTGSAADAGAGSPIRLFCNVGTAFNTLTSLAIQLQCDSADTFGSPKTLWSVSFLLAELTANTKLNLPPIPAGCERFVRLNYDVTGSNPTTGTITAGLILDDQSWVATDNQD